MADQFAELRRLPALDALLLKPLTNHEPNRKDETNNHKLNMSPRDQNLALALHMGWQLKWQDSETLRVLNPHGNLVDLAYCNGRTQDETINDLHYCFPNYHGDLNAVVEVEKRLKSTGGIDFNGARYSSQQSLYVCLLIDAISGEKPGTYAWPALGPSVYHIFDISTAEAPKRCETLLRTLNLWQE